MGALKPGTPITPELTLVRRLGAGGMATVWLAYDQRRAEEVVVKFLSEALVTDKDARQRFSREVAATAQVRSSHVVRTLEHGISERGIPFLVMERLEGTDLAQRIKKGPLAIDEVQHVLDGLAEALTTAHERGVIHRDIKPANVFLCDAGPQARPFVKLLDFGIAKRLAEETMTGSNALLGTPFYMSPEQLGSAARIDARTDIWAVGILTFHMLTGKMPFRGGNIANVAHSILNDPIPKVTTLRQELPPALDAFFLRALARDPQARYDDAHALAEGFADAVEEYGVTEKRSEPPRSSTSVLGGGGSRPVLANPSNNPEDTLPIPEPAPRVRALSTPPPPPGTRVLPPFALPLPPAPAPAPSFPAIDASSFPSSSPRVPARSVPPRPAGDSAFSTRVWLVAGVVSGVVLVFALPRVGTVLHRTETVTASAATTAPPLPSATDAPLPSATDTHLPPAPPTGQGESAAAPSARPPASAGTPRKLPSSRMPLKPRDRGDRDDVGF